MNKELVSLSWQFRDPSSTCTGSGTCRLTGPGRCGCNVYINMGEEGAVVLYCVGGCRSPKGLWSPRHCFSHIHRYGVNLLKLWPLNWTPQTINSQVLVPTRMDLINARCLVNKTLILKDFFTSNGLDFLCVLSLGVSGSVSPAFYLSLYCLTAHILMP